MGHRIQTSFSSAPPGRRTREDARRFDAMVSCSHRPPAEATQNFPRRIGAPEIDRARTEAGGGSTARWTSRSTSGRPPSRRRTCSPACQDEFDRRSARRRK